MLSLMRTKTYWYMICFVHCSLTFSTTWYCHIMRLALAQQQDLKLKNIRRELGQVNLKSCGMLLNIDSLSLINSPEVYVEIFCLTRLYGVLWINYNENKSPAYSGAYEVEYGGCGALRGREPRLRKDGSPNWRHSASATVQEKTNRNQP